jgi:hypothetical protein
MSSVRLSDLLRRDVPSDPVITGVTADSRRVGPGSLFVALPGTAADGRAFIPQALTMGAAAVLAPTDTPHGAAPVLVTSGDVRRAYALAARFTYQPRWTARHFGIQRDLVRAMCLDAGDELRAAWRAIGDAGGPESAPEAMALLLRLPDTPEPLTWASAIGTIGKLRREEVLRLWTAFFRQSYREAEARARKR